ncbi:hypothetical protein BJF93_06615 [Xaviernesmea oryzae]|uniref:Trans-aconitate methyltransferase n=1 Tax=Xaviernesmea oryzae TaxID=464029 RepID=A0A1Q9ASD1_9HYPH|nr:class I SAM-dependent methyltransferase [Xaviernesmea oryzae]OLP58281.1 hypothetical protein BJF93_06615 [Xaviernesmea oryzae]SEL43669.1 hypothetical protein SAMN04487976_10889 [Xaviernesmea oryzae]
MRMFRRHLLPWIKVLVCQILALALVLTLLPMLPDDLRFGPGWVLLFEGSVAALFGLALRLPRIFFPIQLLLPLAILYSDVVPAWAFLIAFVLFALVYWNSASEQVPLYLTNAKAAAALAELADGSGAKSLVDLGSGLGDVVLHVARLKPEISATGIETAPLVFALSRLRVWLARRANARIVYRSLWDEDLSAYDLVYCFLSPVPMPRLYEKARREMRPGTLLVSNSFIVPDVTPERVVAVEDGRRTQLHIYRMG